MNQRELQGANTYPTLDHLSSGHGTGPGKEKARRVAGLGAGWARGYFEVMPLTFQAPPIRAKCHVSLRRTGRPGLSLSV